MASTIDTLTVDCADPALVSAFWCEVLGYVVRESDQDSTWIQNPSGAGPDILFMIVPEPKTLKNRWHLDLTPPETMRAEVDRVRGLGATVFAEMRLDETFWTIMRDPEGNEFCILRGPVDRALQAEASAAAEVETT